MLTQRLFELENSSVRNLAWAIGAPSLIVSLDGLPILSDSFHERELEGSWDWLLMLDKDPSTLEAHLETPRTGRLGIYFERLLSFWLKNRSEYELVADNLQVREKGHTFGAFDFILRAKDGSFEHWEVAIKYYLKRYDSLDWSSWVGPNKIDRMDKKLSRMRDHQLPLSASPKGRETLKGVGITEPPRQYAFVKGMLFNHWREPAHRPNEASLHQPAGIWVELGDLERYSKELNHHSWLERTKPNWLVPVRSDGANLWDRQAVLDRGQDLDRPIKSCVCILSEFSSSWAYSSFSLHNKVDPTDGLDSSITNLPKSI